MKKVVSIIVCLVLLAGIVSLTGCGTQTTDTKATTTVAATTQAATTAAAITAAAVPATEATGLRPQGRCSR